MSKTRAAAVGAVLILAAAGGAWWLQGRDPKAAAPGEGAALAQNGAASAPAGAASAPPVSVSTVRAQRRDVPVQLLAPGTVASLRSVEVKPQVASVVQQVHVREGQTVRRGQLLFTLDARADEANVAKAQAQLLRDQASAADAQRQLARQRELLQQNFVSQGAVDTAQAQAEAAAALVAADRAALESARVALSYSRITAPGDGRIGTVNAYPGTSVSPSGAGLLTLTQIDPIAVSFNVPQRELPALLALLDAGGGRVEARLPEARGALTGRLQFVDNAVDLNSGTVKAKAVFDNRAQSLWPGAFVDVGLTLRTLKDAVVVPQAALIQGPNGQTLFVVESGERAAARRVRSVHATGADAVVEGVQPGERVVVDGRQNLRPGVRVVEREGSGAAGGGGAAPGASQPAGSGGGGALSVAAAASQAEAVR